MQREIKFRAWIPRLNKIEPVTTLDWFGEDEDFEEPDITTRSLQVRDEPILMQFTGICDKNGKEIWEGDILKYAFYENPIEIGKVEWKKNVPGFAINGIWQFDLFGLHSLEVIGNIYEHPELLKKAGENG